MSEAKVIFNFEGINMSIQCTKEEKMKDICQRYEAKVQKKMNSLIFLYGGKQLNFELSFEEQANSLDKENKEMKVLVYKKEKEDFVCPNCGEKIKLKTEKLDELILSNNNIKEKIEGIVFNIDMIIKSCSLIVNSQLKNVNFVLNAIKEDIKKNNEKINNLLNDNININDKFNQNQQFQNNFSQFQNNQQQ